MANRREKWLRSLLSSVLTTPSTLLIRQCVRFKKRMQTLGKLHMQREDGHVGTNAPHHRRGTTHCRVDYGNLSGVGGRLCFVRTRVGVVPYGRSEKVTGQEGHYRRRRASELQDPAFREAYEQARTEIAEPKPIPRNLVCAVCGQDWKAHWDAPTPCIELLKAKLARTTWWTTWSLWTFPGTSHSTCREKGVKQ